MWIEYYSELTSDLDALAGLDNDEWFKHYILIDDRSLKERVFAIRVPGGTVGAIWIDHNNVITKIEIDRNYVIKTYPENVKDIVQKYVGTVIR